MWWEFGGGNAVAIINIPTVKNWENLTGLPLDRRDSILQFIGEHVMEDQTSGRGGFMIRQDEMTIYVSDPSLTEHFFPNAQQLLFLRLPVPYFRRFPAILMQLMI